MVKSSSSPIQKKQENQEKYIFLEENKDFSDMEIVCSGEVFRCHRIIMSASSPVFRAMFQAKMKESESNRVIIDDIMPATMTELLYYIYTGLVKETVSIDSVVDLLVAADKYMLDALKNICQDKLCSVLDAENAIELSYIGEMYRVLKLKDIALMEIVKNEDSAKYKKKWGFWASL